MYTNLRDTREKREVSAVKMGCRYQKPKRAIPLIENQQECLVSLIGEKKDVVMCMSQKKLWKEITILMPQILEIYPDTAQLKRALDQGLYKYIITSRDLALDHIKRQ